MTSAGEAVRVGSGKFTYEVVPQWPLNIEGINKEVAGVAVNSRDEVHVLTRSAHPLLIFDRDGRFLRSWGEGLFTNTHGIFIAPDDTVFIADNGDHTVRKFSPKGELLLELGTKGQPSDSGYTGNADFRTTKRGAPPFNEPTNVAIGPGGEIFISDGYGNARIHVFSGDGKLTRWWGEPGNEPGHFNTPHSVFIGPTDNRVYVADRENDRVQVFDTQGSLLATWTDTRRPDDIYITADGLVYVAELGHRAGLVPSMPQPTDQTPVSRVTIRDLDGKTIASWGADENPASREPTAPGNFFAAHGIWVDREGWVYVGEVIFSGNGPEGSGAGYIAPGAHALQVFRPV